MHVHPSLLLLLMTFFIPATVLAETSRVSEGLETLHHHLEINLQEHLAAVKIDLQSIKVEFSTDGCSGGLSVGWQYLSSKIERIEGIHGLRPPWESCCITHDHVYYSGGERFATPAYSYQLRRQADQALRDCVIETGRMRMNELRIQYHISGEDVNRLYAVIGAMMYQAVRIGGMPCTGLPWRWGYGWPQCNLSLRKTDKEK